MSAQPDANVVALLARAAAATPHRPALVLDAPRAESVSFAALWERVCRISTGLRQRGLEPGDRVIVMVPMSVELYATMLGILKAGAVAVFVDPWVGIRQIAAFAAFAEPRGYIGLPSSHLVRLLEGTLRSLPLSVTTGPRVWRIPARLTLAEIEGNAGDQTIHPVAADDPALITFTTGSSGMPKGANRTHGFLRAQHAALTAELPNQDDDVDMPMFPVFALNNIACGITSVVPAMDFRRVANARGPALLDQMRAHGVTTATASPPFFDRVAEAIARAHGPRPALRRLVTGGAPVSDGQLEAWRAVFPDAEIVVAYGSTEAEPVAHLTAEERRQAHSSRRPLAPGYAMGRPVPLVHTRIVRIARDPIVLGPAGWGDWELPEGDIGELVVSGQHVCRGYYRNPDADRENKIAAPGGEIWHRMGDTGYFDGGQFWLVGRLHSTIWRSGRAVHPQLLEQAAGAAHPGVRQAAAIGMPDPALGERVTLVVHAPAPEGVADAVRRAIESAGLVVDDLRLWPEPLPVDPRHNSKIVYAEVRRRLQEAASA
jgi:acyl-CoA synthetase (AMP-forming)/AMP-acid ligase II